MSVGERIHQARKMAQLSLRDLAAKVDVSHAAISKYERGEDMPGSGVLLSLAKALNVRVDYFLRPQSTVLVNPTFRKRASLSKKAKEELIERTRDWLERYLEIETIVRAEGSAFHMPPSFPHAVSTVEEIEQAALDLRAEWGLGKEPIRDMTALLEDKGIKVGLLSAAEAFDACFFWADADEHIPVIVMREGNAGDRQRFNLAHELGHLVLTPKGVDEEKAAMRFAGAFLVPVEAARRELGVPPQRQHVAVAEFVSLREKYGMSVQAWVYRASELGFLSQAGNVQMQRYLSTSGNRKQQMGNDCFEEKPQRQERLVMRACAEELISETRAAELLGASAKEFAARYYGTPDVADDYLCN